MDLKVGDKIKYNFPNPHNSLNKSFFGIIEIIGDTHVYLRNEDGVRLKVSFKHFDLMELCAEKEELEPVSEIYFG
ncbi:MAG: hypothetical protein A2068_02035 [Ignavibacteria bacterium GWB2_35_6b]|nr:MAG: hypothetical protein A2068_02035 [Ignavibacteria bacterium GWB2_35_6b]